MAPGTPAVVGRVQVGEAGRSIHDARGEAGQRVAEADTALDAAKGQAARRRVGRGRGRNADPLPPSIRGAEDLHGVRARARAEVGEEPADAPAGQEEDLADLP